MEVMFTEWRRKVVKIPGTGSTVTNWSTSYPSGKGEQNKGQGQSRGWTSQDRRVTRQTLPGLMQEKTHLRAEKRVLGSLKGPSTAVESHKIHCQPFLGSFAGIAQINLSKLQSLRAWSSNLFCASQYSLTSWSHSFQCLSIPGINSLFPFGCVLNGN